MTSSGLTFHLVTYMCNLGRYPGRYDITAWLEVQKLPVQK